MLSTKREQADFCTEFNISDEKFRNSRMTWAELDQIAEDFERKKNEHLNTFVIPPHTALQCFDVHSFYVQSPLQFDPTPPMSFGSF